MHLTHDQETWLTLVFAAILAALILLTGCTSPSFALVNIILPGGRVQVGQNNEYNGKTQSEAKAVPEKYSEVGEAGSTARMDNWKITP